VAVSSSSRAAAEPAHASSHHDPLVRARSSSLIGWRPVCRAHASKSASNCTERGLGVVEYH